MVRNPGAPIAPGQQADRPHRACWPGEAIPGTHRWHEDPATPSRDLRPWWLGKRVRRGRPDARRVLAQPRPYWAIACAGAVMRCGWPMPENATVSAVTCTSRCGAPAPGGATRMTQCCEAGPLFSLV